MTAIRVNNKKITSSYLIDYFLSEYMFIQTYRQTDIGTILDSLNVKGIKQIEILVPDYNILNLYETVSRPIRELIEMNNEIREFNNDELELEFE